MEVLESALPPSAKNSGLKLHSNVHSKRPSGGMSMLYAFSEVLSKLHSTLSHITEIKHECGKNCFGIDHIKWCIGNLEIMNSYSSIKRIVTDSDDQSLYVMLSEFAEGDESSVEVAKFLSSSYRTMQDNSKIISKSIMTQTSSSLQRANHRASLRNKDEFIEPDQADVISVLSVGKKPKEQLSNLLEHLDNWDCNMIEIGELIGKPLTTVVYIILQKRNLFKTFDIPLKPMVLYMFQIEEKYRTTNPYHNQLHAADVVQTMHCLLSANLLAQSLSDLEILAMIFASAIHDVDHPGTSNQYLIRIKAPLAILYSDKHVLENHHLAVAFKIMFEEKNNFLSCLSDDDFEEFRRIVIGLVISTDMTLHVKVTSAFQVCAQKCFKKDVFMLNEYCDRMDVMKGLMHFADISNPAKPLEVYQHWVNRITDEFFAQGDLERAAGLVVSPLCDRLKTDVGKGQTGFIEYIVRPLCEAVIHMLNCCDQQQGDVLEGHLQANFTFYKEYTRYSLEKVGDSPGKGNISKNAGNIPEVVGRATADPIRTTLCLKFKTPQFFQIIKKPPYNWVVEEDSD